MTALRVISGRLYASWRDDSEGVWLDAATTCLVLVGAVLFGMPSWAILPTGVLLWTVFGIERNVARIEARR